MSLKRSAKKTKKSHNKDISRLVLKFIGLSLFAATGLSASESEWVSGKTQKSQVRLVSPLSSISPTTESIRFGLEFKLAKGWHVYWKNPGDIGYPPKLKWNLPKQWRASELFYPTPEKFEASTFTAYGYHGSVVYLVDLMGPGLSEKYFNLSLTVDYLVCEVQCLPEHAVLNLSLKNSKESLSPHARNLDLAFSQIPAALSSAIYKVSNQTNKSLRLTFSGAQPIEDIYPAPINSKTKVKVSKVESQVFEISSQTRLPSLELLAVWRDGSQKKAGTIEVETSGMNFDLEDLLVALFFAFIGGLILNLMPCVLPVVGLKTISLVKLGLANTRNVRRSALLTVAGILSSFAILALVVIGLRTAGQEVGWGFQFQSPGFITLMVVVIFAFALNLFGLFEFGLPQDQTTKLSGLQRGPFLDGALATLLATPCSAPFLGTALTFALSQPSWLLMIFFIVMGIGLSVPYILLATIPRALKIFPKPGPWMDVLRRALGYSLMLAVFWLLYVVQQQTSILFMFGILVMLLILFITIRELQGRRRWILALLIVSMGIILAERGVNKSDTSVMSHTSFSEEIIQSELRDGHTLYVVVTAEWCLTCKFNEKFVMESSWFEELLKSKNVKVIVFDWTSRDESISNFLKRYDRVAIPFSMLISKEKHLVFPELLSRPNVEERFQNFFGK